MKALGPGLLFAVATLSSVHAQRSPDALPDVTVDCYQSFAAKAPLPEFQSREIAIDGGNLETPLIRYRLEVADKKTLKIIKDPTRPAFRTEHGKSVWEMKRDFTDRHQVVGWREELPGELSGFSPSTSRICCSARSTSRQRVRPPPRSKFM